MLRMTSSESSDVAWDLVQHGRAALTVAELNTVFVRLGVNEYADAIDIMLKAIVRQAGPQIPQRIVEQLTRWAEMRYREDKLRETLTLISLAQNSSQKRP